MRWSCCRGRFVLLPPIFWEGTGESLAQFLPADVGISTKSQPSLTRLCLRTVGIVLKVFAPFKSFQFSCEHSACSFSQFFLHSRPLFADTYVGEEFGISSLVGWSCCPG